jgi:hypothetical protein
MSFRYMIGHGQTSNQVDAYEYFDVQRFEDASSERAPAALRTILASHFFGNRRAWDVVPLARQRISLATDEIAVCDLCIVAADAPVQRTVRSALACIDIISSEPLSLIQNRADAYDSIGVKHFWLLDPVFQTGWRATPAGLFQIRDDQMSIPGTSIGFRLSTVFKDMEEMLRPNRRMSVASALERNRSEVRR